ncbi:hypothetical protein [Streptomyces sp. NPDC058240]|uniref:hypothetical protein n=1 Tax=Streptomyces sp. NPDC058240 TaxID=3346396 RepID=UPI0036E4D31F
MNGQKEALLHEAADWFALDRTEGQRSVYVAAEKDTLRQMFTSWLAEYGIPVLVVRGFASQSYAEVVRRRTARHGRPTLLWCGGFDASGAEIERDWARRTEDCWDEVRRVLLTREQTIEYELPPAQGKHGDPRWPAFADHYGLDPAHPVQWEIEALEPAELQRLVLAAVTPYIDHPVHRPRRTRPADRPRGRTTPRPGRLPRRLGHRTRDLLTLLVPPPHHARCSSAQGRETPSPPDSSGRKCPSSSSSRTRVFFLSAIAIFRGAAWADTE